jgi:hypothetical protein
MKAIAIAAVLTLMSAPAGAQDKHATAALVEKNQASLAISDAACADNPECVEATLGCETGGSFVASMDGVESPQAAALVKDRKASLAVDGRVFALDAQKLEFSEMDGAWRIEFGCRDSSSDIWKALATAKKVTLAVASRKLVIPGDKNVAKVARACGK